MKTIKLCGICVAKMADGYKLTQLPAPPGNKVVCGLFRRKRLGETYQVEKKEQRHD